MVESLPSIIRESICCVLSKAGEQEETGYDSPRTALTSITVDHHNILFIFYETGHQLRWKSLTLEKNVHVKTCLEEDVKSR